MTLPGKKRNVRLLGRPPALAAIVACLFVGCARHFYPPELVLNQPFQTPPNYTPAASHQAPAIAAESSLDALASKMPAAPDGRKEVEVLPPPRTSMAVLTIDQAINVTLIADPRLRSGFEIINQANADLLTAALPPNPTLYMDAQLLPLTRPFTVTDQGGPPQTDFQLSMPIDWLLFGKRAAAMASANLGVRANELTFADQVRLRVTETANAFFDVLEAKALLQLGQQDIDNFKRIESATKLAVENGGRPQVDLNRVRLDLLNSQRLFREANANLVTAKARLRALLGRTDADPEFDIDGDLSRPLVIGPISADEIYRVGLENRPDIECDRIQLEQAEANTRLEDRRGLPSVTPQVGYTRQFQTKAIGFPDANCYLLALTTSMPFIDRNQGNRSKARSFVVQRRFELQTDLVDLRSEADQIAKQFEIAYQNATAVAEEQLKLATEVRDSINKAYAAGGRPLVDALDAERNFRDTYRTYISGRANYWRALYRVNAAAGKQVAK